MTPVAALSTSAQGRVEGHLARGKLKFQRYWPVLLGGHLISSVSCYFGSLTLGSLWLRKAMGHVLSSPARLAKRSSTMCHRSATASCQEPASQRRAISTTSPSPLSSPDLLQVVHPAIAFQLPWRTRATRRLIGYRLKEMLYRLSRHPENTTDNSG